MRKSVTLLSILLINSLPAVEPTIFKTQLYIKHTQITDNPQCAKVRIAFERRRKVKQFGHLSELVLNIRIGFLQRNHKYRFYKLPLDAKLLKKHHRLKELPIRVSPSTQVIRYILLSSDGFESALTKHLKPRRE